MFCHSPNYLHQNICTFARNVYGSCANHVHFVYTMCIKSAWLIICHDKTNIIPFIFLQRICAGSMKHHISLIISLNVFKKSHKHHNQSVMTASHFDLWFLKTRGKHYIIHIYIYILDARDIYFPYMSPHISNVTRWSDIYCIYHFNVCFFNKKVLKLSKTCKNSITTILCVERNILHLCPLAILSIWPPK